jgi:hypothetical protein
VCLIGSQPAGTYVCRGFLFGLRRFVSSGCICSGDVFLGVAMPQILKFKKIEDWTGGAQGIVIGSLNHPLDQIESGSVAILYPCHIDRAIRRLNYCATE